MQQRQLWPATIGDINHIKSGDGNKTNEIGSKFTAVEWIGILSAGIYSEHGDDKTIDWGRGYSTIYEDTLLYTSL